jgi:hypothetical protein
LKEKNNPDQANGSPFVCIGKLVAITRAGYRKPEYDWAAIKFQLSVYQ